MITVFNRQELIVTLSMDRQSEIRRALKEGGIEYKLKVTNLQNAPVMHTSRTRTGSLGIDQSVAYEYRFFVHKKDYDKAMAIINV